MTAWAAWRSARAASPATVVRLSRRLGYAGYAALKLAIAHEAGRADQFGYGRAQADSTARLHERVMADDAHSIRGAARAIDAVRTRRGAGRHRRRRARDVRRCRGSAALAALATFRFSALGIRVSSAMDALVQHLQADTLGAGDVCVAISHTGESRDTIDVATAASRAGAITIGITGSAGSPLTQAVRIALVAPTSTTRRHESCSPTRWRSCPSWARSTPVSRRGCRPPRRQQRPPGRSPLTSTDPSRSPAVEVTGGGQ